MQLALSLCAPDPRTTVRRSDPSSSVIVAAERIQTGRAGHEAQIVLRCLRLFPGATSAELAHWTQDIGQSELGQSEDPWRSTIARRLPGLEDAGLVRAEAPAFKTARPRRRINPSIAPCRVGKSPKGNPLKAIRWWPLQETK